MPPVIATWILSHIGATAGVFLPSKCGLLEHSARLRSRLGQHFILAQTVGQNKGLPGESHHVIPCPTGEYTGYLPLKILLYLDFYLDYKQNVKRKSYLVDYINTNPCLHKTIVVKIT